MPRNFKLINVNARSILNKVDDFDMLLNEHQPDVVVITETWLHSSVDGSEIVFTGYKIMRKDRCSRGGGVAILFKDTLNFTIMDEVEGTESCWVKVTSLSSPIIIGVYRPLDAAMTLLENPFSCLTSIVQKYKHVILAGDFNLPNIN